MSAEDKSSGGAMPFGAEIEGAIDAALAEYAKVAEQQKEVLTVIARQQAAFFERWKKGLDQASTGMADATATFRRLGDEAAAAQKQLVDAAAAQHASNWEAAQKHWTESGDVAADAVKRGLNAFAETQRLLLTLVPSRSKSHP